VQKRIVSYYVGQLFIILALFMSIPMAVAYYDNDSNSIRAFAFSMLTAVCSGLLLRFISYRLKVTITTIARKEAFGIVAFAWIGSGFLAGLPFIFSGSLTSLSSATFEAISGLSTTGATVFSDVEVLSRAINMWRLTMHWVGGMGIVVLFVAIFPQLGLGGKYLFRSESSGPMNESIKPRIKQTALRLWWIYVFLTTLCGSLLYLAGMNIFDSIIHAFSTLSTGGFSNKNASVGFYKNPLIEWIIIFFMLMGGISFNLYYGLFRGEIKRIFMNIEARFFLFLNFVVAIVIFILTSGFAMDQWHNDFRSVLFQTVAVSSTTGLMTADFDVYPMPAKYLLFLLMFIGGCAGSTAGGLKISRVVIVFKRCLQELRLTLHPQEVVSTKLGRQTIPRNILSATFIFVCTYFFLYLFGVFIMFCLGLEWTEASSSVVACFSSVGPGFGSIGPTQNYGLINPIGKYVLCFYMIAGRLEIFVLLSIFTPHFWRKG